MLPATAAGYVSLMLPLMVPVGQLLGPAFACGLSLYATVALIGIAGRLELATLPAGLRGLENGVVIGSAVVFFVIEFVVDKIRYADSAWDAVHTVVRPLSATLLAMLALAAAPIELRVGGALAAGATALAAHGTKAGFRAALNTRPRRGLRAAASLLENVLAVALVGAALIFPQLALGAVALLAVALLRVAPPLWRAAMLGTRAALARWRGFFGVPGWRGVARMPKRLRPLLATHKLGAGAPVATRAAMLGLRGAGAYRNGWLVLEHGEPTFLFRAGLRSRRMRLPKFRNAHVHKGLLADTIELETGSSPLTLFLLRDGPPTEAALAQIASN